MNSNSLSKEILAFLPCKRREARCRGNSDEVVDDKDDGKRNKKLRSKESIEEIQGKLSRDPDKDRLMHSILENDKKIINKGMILAESFNQGLGSFTPDMMMEKFVDDYKTAKQIYGESLLRHISGYDSRYIEKNIKIPEFQRELLGKMKEKMLDLRKEGLIDKKNTITDKGIELASLVLYVEEIDNLMPKGIFGEKFHKKSSIYGDKGDARNFRKKDRYKDIAVRKSLKSSIRRGHSRLISEDLKTFEREAKGSIYLVYALDSSGSMKGEKIALCKKAGIALVFKALEEKDKVGLIVFGADISKTVMPTDDFNLLLREMATIKASAETNLAATIKKAVEMFPAKDVTKHLILLTDAIPTIGEKPEVETLEAASLAAANNITISVVGINLEKKGEELAKKIAEITKGKLYAVKDAENVDKIVLEDYYSV